MKDRVSTLLLITAMLLFSAMYASAATIPTLTTEIVSGNPTWAGAKFSVDVKIVNPTTKIPCSALTRVYWSLPAYVDLDIAKTIEGNTNGVWGLNEKALGPIVIGEKIPIGGGWVYRDIGTFGNVDNTETNPIAFTRHFKIDDNIPMGVEYSVLVGETTILGAITIGEVKITLVDLGDGLVFEIKEIVEMSEGHDFSSDETAVIQISGTVPVELSVFSVE